MTKASILIVEDEAIVAADLAGMLGRLGYEVVGTTGYGEDAITLAREHRPDLVLMDIRLAGAMDGVEAAGIIHRELDLPVIFLTAHSDQATLERAKRSEPFGYLLKPFEELGLETHIEMALYKHQAERKLRQAHDELELRVQERTRELQVAEQELRMVNESLERRVDERTAELQAANAKLLDSRRASLNMMEDAVAARRRAEEASLELQREATERKLAENATIRSEDRYHTLFNSLIEGFCIIEVLFDADERPVDYRFLEINPAFEAQTGLQNAQGKLMRELAPEHEAHWFEIYGKVALTGEPACFVNEAKALNRWFNVCAYRIGEQDSRKVAILFNDITEAKLAEEALHENRERLDLAMASSRMATFDWDIVKNKRTWSDGVHSLLGTKPETFTGTAEEFFRIIHPEDRSSVQANLARAVETVGVYETEYRAVWPDGSIHHISARGKVHSNDAGQPVLMAGVCWDVSERKRAEERLWAQARTLKALNSSSHALLHATDELSLLQAVCRTVVEDCGHSMVWIGFAEEDEAKSVRPVASAGFEEGYLESLGITWADNERGRGPTGTAIRTGKPRSCADMLSDPAFEPWRSEALKRGYASSLVLPLMGDGKAFGALSIYSPKPNAFTEEETDLLMQLADELAYGIRTVRLRVAHEQAEEMLGAYYRRQNLLADTAGRLLAADSPQQIVDSLCQKVMEFLDCQAFFNFLVDEKEGRLHLNACAGIPEEEKLKIEWLDYGVAVCGCAARDECRIVAEDIPNTPDPRTELVKSYGIQAYACHPLMVQGRVLGTLSFGTCSRTSFSDNDLSLMKAVADQVAIAMERKRVEEELRHSKEAAEAANRAKSQFLANMSHELRTPMTGVLGMLDLALGGALDTQQREYICTAHNSARSLLRIINDILDLTKVEAGKLTLEEKPFSARECITSVIEILIPEARRKGLELIQTVVGDVPENVIGDQTRLRQILTNLCGNAVKFTDHGKVEVRVTAGDKQSDGRRMYAFTVTDTGIGIPHEKRALLFQAFSQVDDSNTRKYGGTGLGLAICREIVECMGGTMEFNSEEGVGSTFIFSVPLGEATMERVVAVTEQIPVTARISTSASGGGKKARLLLAEDDPTIRHLLKVTLNMSNFELDVAENGRKAVEMWEHGNYDLILMDVQMPVMDGFDATRAIRSLEESRGGHTLIVAMTAHALKKDEIRCLEAGMDDYISKPIDLKASIRLIKDLICQRDRKES